MSQIVIEQLSLAFGQARLLDQINLTIESGEKLCLVGRNGEGKSTLLKIVNGQLKPDEGRIIIPSGIRVSMLEQQVPAQEDILVRDLVAQGHESLQKLLDEWHQLIEQESADQNRIGQLQLQIEADDGWQYEQQVQQVLSRLSLDGDMKFGQLSGGWRRRVLLARALVRQPHILLLDEPTNHLDIEAIEWLEKLIRDFQGTLIFISHDRRFIDAVATSILELDRGKITSFPGSYQNYLDRKQELLGQEENQNKLFDKKLAQEEVWIRQGIKARRTRNEGRVRALKKLREERQQRRERQDTAGFSLSAKERSGKQVFVVENLNYSLPDKSLIKNFSTLVERGDKIALIGPNGVGKTTLIKLLLGELTANSGNIEQGTKLEVAYFDQTQDVLDPEATVLDTVAQGSEQVEVQGKTKHIYSYLQDFLFTPERARSPIKSLSGGERNRVLLARLFTKAFNLLIMDEPTNDLDLETLELLEEQLLGFDGTLILVSHDRSFVDSVVTQSWVFEGHGKISEWVGGYSDWKNQSSALTARPVMPAQSDKEPQKASQKRNKKLSYKLQLELDQLPAEIEQLESHIEQLNRTIADPAFYSQDPESTMPVLQELQDTEAALEQKMERWMALEAEANPSE